MKIIATFLSMLLLLVTLPACQGSPDVSVPSDTLQPTETGTASVSPMTTPVTEESTPPDEDTHPSETVPSLVKPAEPIPDDAIDVTSAWGIRAGEGYGLSNSLMLAEKMASLPNGSTILFPAGSYEIAFPIYLVGKQNIRIVGLDATLIRTGMVNDRPDQPVIDDPAIPESQRYLTALSSILWSVDNRTVSIEGFTFRYSTPNTLSGKVISTESGAAVIELTDGNRITGNEYVTVINTFNKSGIPDRTLEQYAEPNFPIEKIDETTIRVTKLDPGGVSRLRKGTSVCLRLCTGRQFIIHATNTADITFRDLTFESSFNGGIHLSDRCVNATLKNVTVKPYNPNSLMSLNADILHIAGLGGKLIVEDCSFERPGDDCINVHNGAILVEAINGNTVTVRGPLFDLTSLWASVGDTISFYDPATFTCIGTATLIGKHGNGIFTLSDVPEGVTVGSVVANDFMKPSVTIRNTTAKNMRARAFLLQTNDVTVENCTFYGTALAAILIAPDLDRWYEMAPAVNLTIRNNTFESCGHSAAGVIQISAFHDDPNKTYQNYIHKHITIQENVFDDLDSPAVHAVCVDGLTVNGNTVNGKKYRGDLIRLHRCKEVILDNVFHDRADTQDVTGLSIAD